MAALDSLPAFFVFLLFFTHQDMTPTEVRLIQDSFAIVRRDPEHAGGLFYWRLFELDPSLRALFKGDIDEQAKKLMQVLGVAADGLNDPGSLIPVVQQLGIRHAGYGVKAPQYETVGAALIWTLAEVLGEDFTEPTRNAWVSVYGLLSATMIEAAGKPADAQI